MRRRSFKKSFSARTTGKYKRRMKKALIPGYGKKGAGMLHPKRQLYNRIYSKTTFDSRKLLTGFAKRNTKRTYTPKQKINEPIPTANGSPILWLDETIKWIRRIYRTLPFLGFILLFSSPVTGVWFLLIWFIVFLVKKFL